ncbi:MAG: hypothetical protein ACOX7J_08905 [Bacillota bacterium]|jgi:hypothetical protein
MSKKCIVCGEPADSGYIVHRDCLEKIEAVVHCSDCRCFEPTCEWCNKFDRHFEYDDFCSYGTEKEKKQ